MNSQASNRILDLESIDEPIIDRMISSSIESIINFYINGKVSTRLKNMDHRELVYSNRYQPATIVLESSAVSYNLSLYLDNQLTDVLMSIFLGSEDNQNPSLKRELCREVLNQICGLLKEQLSCSETQIRIGAFVDPTGSMHGENPYIWGFEVDRFQTSYIILSQIGQERITG